MDYVTASSVMTVVMLLAFLGIIWWAFSSKRSEAFLDAARLPFEDHAPALRNPDRHSGRQP